MHKLNVVLIIALTSALAGRIALADKKKNDTTPKETITFPYGGTQPVYTQQNVDKKILGPSHT